MWLIPHPVDWLKHAYDEESQRRAECAAQTVVGHLHPIRRILGSLLSPAATDILPQPRVYSRPPASPVDALAQVDSPPATLLHMSCAGSSSAASGALGAAATYSAPFFAFGGRVGGEITLATRLDPGANGPLDNSLNQAHLHAVALVTRAAAAMRSHATEISIAVQSRSVANVAMSLGTSPLGRRRLCSDALDARNEIQIYQLSRAVYDLPNLKFVQVNASGGAMDFATRRTDLASYAELPQDRDFPIGSDWCILEHNGDRVNGAVRPHVLQSMANKSTRSLALLASQGRVLTNTAAHLPCDRMRALGRSAGMGSAL